MGNGHSGLSQLDKKAKNTLQAHIKHWVLAWLAKQANPEKARFSNIHCRDHGASIMVSKDGERVNRGKPIEIAHSIETVEEDNQTVDNEAGDTDAKLILTATEKRVIAHQIQCTHSIGIDVPVKITGIAGMGELGVKLHASKNNTTTEFKEETQEKERQFEKTVLPGRTLQGILTSRQGKLQQKFDVYLEITGSIAVELDRKVTLQGSPYQPKLEKKTQTVLIPIQDIIADLAAEHPDLYHTGRNTGNAYLKIAEGVHQYEHNFGYHLAYTDPAATATNSATSIVQASSHDEARCANNENLLTLNAPPSPTPTMVGNFQPIPTAILRAMAEPEKTKKTGGRKWPPKSSQDKARDEEPSSHNEAKDKPTKTNLISSPVKTSSEGHKEKRPQPKGHRMMHR